MWASTFSLLATMSRVIEKEKKISELNYAFTVEGFQIALQATFCGFAKERIRKTKLSILN